MMKRITFIEFETGDPLPEWVTYVTDNEGHRWDRDGDMFVYQGGGMDDYSWEGLTSLYGPIRTPEPSPDEVRMAAYELRSKAELLVARADAMMAEFGIKA
jgi:hypothetical protein